MFPMTANARTARNIDVTSPQGATGIHATKGWVHTYDGDYPLYPLDTTGFTHLLDTDEMAAYRQVMTLAGYRLYSKPVHTGDAYYAKVTHCAEGPCCSVRRSRR